MRFDKDEFVSECLAAIQADHRPQRAVKEIVQRAVSSPLAIEAEVHPHTESPMMTVWHRSDEFTALHVVWPPGVDLFAHDHNMWAVIGLYGGREDNQFYRRLEDGTIEPHSSKSFHERHVASLGSSIVHSVSNPTREWTAAIHVYGGEYFTTPRTMWDKNTFQPMVFDPDVTRQVLEDAASSARLADTPGKRP